MRYTVHQPATVREGLSPAASPRCWTVHSSLEAPLQRLGTQQHHSCCFATWMTLDIRLGAKQIQIARSSPLPFCTSTQFASRLSNRHSVPGTTSRAVLRLTVQVPWTGVARRNSDRILQVTMPMRRCWKYCITCAAVGRSNTTRHEAYSTQLHQCAYALG